MRPLPLVALLALLAPLASGAAENIERNVVFGMYSGLALVMDVYRPTKPNGAAVVAIQGSAWYAPMRYDAESITTRSEIRAYGRHLSQAGYVVFVINHRAAPRFRFPAPLEDAQRAVRYVRAHAANYQIDPLRIGAFGSSSGGHLANLLGTMEGTGNPQDDDPIERQSAKVQAVATLFAPSDLPAFWKHGAIDAVTALMGFAYVDVGRRRPGSARESEPEIVAYRLASPVSHVTQDDAPTLMIHGEADEVVPIEQSERLQAALQAAGVKARLIRVPGGMHGDNFRLSVGDPRVPDHKGEVLRWFDAELKVSR